MTKTHIGGHWVTHLRRGTLPLPLNERIKLKRDGYRVFVYQTQAALQQKVDRILEHTLKKRREPPMKKNEWVATKRVWREPYVRTVLNAD